MPRVFCFVVDCFQLGFSSFEDLFHRKVNRATVLMNSDGSTVDVDIQVGAKDFAFEVFRQAVLARSIKYYSAAGNTTGETIEFIEFFLDGFGQGW